MGFEFYRESYAGAIKEISIGEGSKTIIIGGETCYPFCQFEGEMPNKPRIAMEVWDMEPKDWPEAALSHFKDVIGDSAAWAKKCVEVYGAEIIVLQLKSTDPNGLDIGPEAVSNIVKNVLSSIDVPLIVWGIANAEKDEAVFKKIAEDCQDYNLIFGPVEDKNHKSIGAAAMGYNHFIISSSPIDVNLAKQVNILLENLGMPMDKVFIDPTTGGLGYGLEYSYSVMERLRMAALTQGDDKLQMPIINNLGNEVWKCKEVKQSIQEAPLLGDPEKRGILMEAVAAVTYLLAGSNIVIMRHPEAIRLVKDYINLIVDGGNGMKVASIEKQLGEVQIDLVSLSPTPNLTIESDVKEKKKIKGNLNASDSKKKSVLDSTKKKTGLSSASAPSSSNAKVSKSSKVNKKDNLERAETVKSKENNKVLVDVKEEAKLKAEKRLEEQRKAEIEKNNKIEAEIKAKETARLAKLKVEEEAIANEAKEREQQEEAVRAKRAEECAKLGSTQKGIRERISKSIMTPAAEQKEYYEKIVNKLQWVHRRVMLYKW